MVRVTLGGILYIGVRYNVRCRVVPFNQYVFGKVRVFVDTDFVEWSDRDRGLPSYITSRGTRLWHKTDHNDIYMDYIETSFGYVGLYSNHNICIWGKDGGEHFLLDDGRLICK